MTGELVQIGEVVVNLLAVASAHWDDTKGGRRLFVYYVGGRFTQHQGEEADQLWAKITEAAKQEVAAYRSALRLRQ